MASEAQRAVNELLEMEHKREKREQQERERGRIIPVCSCTGKRCPYGQVK